jgi:hypothetical protein
VALTGVRRCRRAADRSQERIDERFARALHGRDYWLAMVTALDGGRP